MSSAVPMEKNGQCRRTGLVGLEERQVANLRREHEQQKHQSVGHPKNTGVSDSTTPSSTRRRALPTFQSHLRDAILARWRHVIHTCTCLHREGHTRTLQSQAVAPGRPRFLCFFALFVACGATVLISVLLLCHRACHLAQQQRFLYVVRVYISR